MSVVQMVTALRPVVQYSECDPVELIWACLSFKKRRHDLVVAAGYTSVMDSDLYLMLMIRVVRRHTPLF